MVTVPLPATMVPVTFVVLHPAPVQTEIGSAFAVPWVKARSPMAATASSEFLRFKNLGISRLLGVNNSSLPSRSPGSRPVLLEACIAERCGASARSKIPARETSRSGRESNYTWHVPVVKQKVGQHSVLLGFAEIQRFYVSQMGMVQQIRSGMSSIQTVV